MDYRRRRLGEIITDHLGLGLTTLLAALVQTNLLPSFFQAPFNLVLVAAAIWTMLEGGTRGALVAFYGGLSLDLLAWTPLGSHALALLLVVIMTHSVAERLPTENWLLVLIVAALGTAIYHLTLLVLNGADGNLTGWALVVLIPGLFINLVLALPEFLVLQWWQEHAPAREP